MIGQKLKELRGASGKGGIMRLLDLIIIAHPLQLSNLPSEVAKQAAQKLFQVVRLLQPVHKAWTQVLEAKPTISVGKVQGRQDFEKIIDGKSIRK